MITIGEDELTCDLAETYGIFDMRSLPVSTLAVLADGLGPESRIKRKISRREDVDFDTLLRARAVDLLALLVWMRTEDGVKNRNRPASIVDALTKKPEETEQRKLKSFRTAEDFQRAWKAGGGG